MGRIEYRYHPFYGTEVQVVRALRSSVAPIDIVRLPQGFQIAVPRWMLDPVICHQLPQEAKPRLAVSALFRLAELIRKGRWPGHHAYRQETSLLSSALTPSQEVALGAVSGIETTALSPTPGSNAAAAPPPLRAGKDQS